MQILQAIGRRLRTDLHTYGSQSFGPARLVSRGISWCTSGAPASSLTQLPNMSVQRTHSQAIHTCQGVALASQPQSLSLALGTTVFPD